MGTGMEILVGFLMFATGFRVGVWFDRRQAGQLRYSHLSGSDCVYLYGGELTGKWQRCRREDGSIVGS